MNALAFFVAAHLASRTASTLEVFEMKRTNCRIENVAPGIPCHQDGDLYVCDPAYRPARRVEICDLETNDGRR